MYRRLWRKVQNGRVDPSVSACSLTAVTYFRSGVSRKTRQLESLTLLKLASVFGRQSWQIWPTTERTLLTALAFFREHKREMRALRRVVVGEEGATVKDINGKSMHLSGVTLGRPELEDLLRMAGASYDPKH